MTDHLSLAQRLSADSPAKLERAAQNRFDTAEILRGKERRLAAVYLYGYCAEMCLSSAYFRSAGFTAIMPIDRDTRNRRMAQARRQRGANGEFLMNSDPHPIMGWAQFLYWHRLIPGTNDRSARSMLEGSDQEGNASLPELATGTAVQGGGDY